MAPGKCPIEAFSDSTSKHLYCFCYLAGGVPSLLPSPSWSSRTGLKIVRFFFYVLAMLRFLYFPLLPLISGIQ